MNQFWQKKKFDVAQKGILGKTHFRGYSVTRVCKILNRVFLVKIGFFFGVLPIKRFILGLFCLKLCPKLSTFFLMLTFLAKFL
jgi:hypothetical protein